jgi:membrane fusion protein (multidrug efflux system)
MIMRIAPPLLLVMVSLSLAVLAGCGRDDAAKPPEKLTPVSVSPVLRRDLPVTESAVGAETALGVALDYDPSRIGTGARYIRLPFPEQVASRLRVGQAVTLSNFTEPERTARGQIREIRPPLNATTLSREVIVTVLESGWRPTGSVRGEVLLGIHSHALVIPEQAMVLRPAGAVVYVVEDGTAREKPVRIGIVRDGLIEILSGLKDGDSVAVDGAALLTGGARVAIRGAGKPAETPKP